MFRRRAPLLAALALLSGACTVGPDYRRPDVTVPATFKEQAAPSPAALADWRPVEPKDGEPRGPWWTVFGDPGLNALEEQVASSNLTISIAEAQLRGARAAARGAVAAFYPTVGTVPSASRSQNVTSRSTTAGTEAPTVTSYSLPVAASWEVDLFGQTRRSAEAGVEGARAAAAQVEAVRLAVQAQVALDWFLLRGTDAQKKLLDSAVAEFEKALRLTKSRHDQGIASGVDVAQAETQLESTRAQATELGIARALLEHAIAILLGRAPSELSLPAEPLAALPPVLPAGLPSDLLERRPDVAAAERRVAAANAQVGVATAAFFPSLVLSASGGWQGSTLAGFFSLPNRFWSIGPALAETIFDGGKRRAAKEGALATYDAAVDTYRLSVLTALQEVEDSLASIRILEKEAEQQARAVAAARRLLTLSTNRYKAGITTYLEVVIAETAALGAERTAVDLKTRRMTASVGLIRALGGGWSSAEMPDGRRLVSRDPAAPVSRP